jgi:hypothetical protein
LRRSVQAEKASAPAAAARPPRAKKGRKNTAQKEMLLPIAGKKSAQSETGKKSAHAETGKSRPHARQRKAS